MANSTYCHCDVIDATMDEDPLMSEKNGDFEYQKDFESLESRCDSSTNRYPCLRLLVSFGTLILCLNLIVVLSMYPMLRAWSIDATCPNPSLSLDGGFAPECKWNPPKLMILAYTDKGAVGLKEMYFEDDIEDYKAAAEQEGDKAWEDRFGCQLLAARSIDLMFLFSLIFDSWCTTRLGILSHSSSTKIRSSCQSAIP